MRIESTGKKRKKRKILKKRVKKCFDRWTDLAKAVDFDSLFFLILKERVLDSCNEEFSAFIKAKHPSTVCELKKYAAAFTESRPTKTFRKANDQMAFSAAFQGAHLPDYVRGQPYSRYPNFHSDRRFSRG
ncbi:hypothetical protein ElyMa_003751200 [Elysia marginata]|uniref:Uncharacterized protein n=1 Tax=Elysia marginata TaxID=1093978 RepID=A0AAV4F897_9GAST|nr:hypothetical protein ElyMa_003751200 [Elysia marginata]